MGGLLYGVAVLFVVLWAIGFFVAHIAFPLIHVLLVLAIAVFVYNMLKTRSA